MLDAYGLAGFIFTDVLNKEPNGRKGLSILVSDPEGNVVELFWNPDKATWDMDGAVNVDEYVKRLQINDGPE